MVGVFLSLANENRRVGIFHQVGKAIQNAPLSSLKYPSALTVRLAMSEILRLIADDLIKQRAFCVLIVICLYYL